MQGETILCVAPRAWDSLWRSTQQIMSRMARQNRILYFEPGRNPDHGLLPEMLRNLPNHVRLRWHAENENLIVIASPTALPYARQTLPRAVLQRSVPFVARVNAHIMIPHIRRAMARFGITRPILWLYEPRHVHLVGQFGEQASCYFNYDEFPMFAYNARIKDLLREYDNRLCRSVDAVFASSRSQYETRQSQNPNTHFVPNAVDFDLFHRALSLHTPLPEEVARLPRPRLGFVGWMGFQIDTALLCKVAEVYAHGSLVLVGPNHMPAHEDLRRLQNQRNVHFVGKKGLQELPGYLKAFDVALLPNRLTDYALTAYPLKLHEYLAAGRAIVATAMPELVPYRHLVRIASSHEQFIRQLEKAIDDYSTRAIEARVAEARKNTWEARVDQIYAVLDRHLGQKSFGGHPAPYDDHPEQPNGHMGSSNRHGERSERSRDLSLRHT